MMKWLLLLMMPVVALAADDGRVSFLEQEVRNLQRQVQALTRQVEALGNEPPRLRGVPAPTPKAVPAASDPAQWIDAEKWRRLKKGMSELDVIALLGAPTSMRETDGARTLFYALEIGASGFLGGNVTLRDRAVVDIRTPTLQ